MAAASRQPYDLYQVPTTSRNARQSNGVGRSPAQRTQYLQNGQGASQEYQRDARGAQNGLSPLEGEASYQDPTQSRSDGSRSFSERVKRSPLTRDTYAEEPTWQPTRQPPVLAPINTRQPIRGNETGVDSARYQTKYNGNVPDPRRRSTTKEDIRNRTVLAQDAVPRRGQSLSQATAARRVAERYPDEAYSPVSPASTIRDPNRTNGDSKRDWASDRSPLQKLEVTLNDISKEEKRARVEEAEMLLREAKAGRGGRRLSKEAGKPQKYHSSRTAPQEQPGLEDAGLVRSLSSTQRDRLHHSATIPNRKPDVRRLSGDGRATFSYEERSPVEPPRDTDKVAVPQSAPLTKSTWKEMSQPHPAHTSSSTQRKQEDVRTFPSDVSQTRTQPQSGRGKNNRQPAYAIPSNITRAVSLQHKQPEASFPDDDDLPRPGPTKESNSSHKAVLSEGAAPAAAAGASGSLGRSNSKKLQKKAPADHSRQQDAEIDASQTRKPSAERSAYMAQRDLVGGKDDSISRNAYTNGIRADLERAGGQRKASREISQPVGLGLQDVSPEESPDDDDDDHHHHHLSDVFRRKSQRQSVSFKQPFDRARPINEWKDAGIARLTAADFDLTDADSVDRNKAWWEDGGSGNRRKSRRASTRQQIPPEATDGHGQTTFNPPLYLKCGPLLRYTGMRTQRHGPQGQSIAEKEMWRGSVMIVTQDSQSSYETVPILRLFSQPKELLPPPPEQISGDDSPLAPEYVDPLAGLTKMSRSGQTLYVKPVDHLIEAQDLSTVETEDGLFEQSPSPIFSNGNGGPSPISNKRTSALDGEAVGKWREVQGARLHADPARGVTFWRFNLEIELNEQQQHVAYRINQGPAIGFWVPARGKAMNIMFHSCNGFSLSVNPNDFSGPDPLWRDVLNTHQTRPFHVMIGGGDQIYNDRVMVQTNHFGNWTKLRNPHEKHHAPFTPEMKEELETFYLDRYAMWFSQGLFEMANSQIPMVNIWDDHDIIDGFGSYPDNFMRTPVFTGLGEVAFKYYMLFQHQSVAEEVTADEPSWLLGESPGPYIQQQSRSLFMSMGRSVAFLGLDCRTERTRSEILTLQTLDLVLDRCRREIVEGETKHLIVLLGVPIAYPRLVWLENVLTSRAMDPIKAMGRYKILKGGFLNKFDGGVEILDDLDDHWTASGHKGERAELIQDLQDLAAEKSVRITILGGDVHLAAIGQFYSKTKLKIPKDRDHRYMPNVISSAIVNTPPPEMMADVLNKRNKIHHFDEWTDEDMIPMFTHDVDGKSRNNKRLLPRRNWCSIREYHPGATPPPSPPSSAAASESGDSELTENFVPEKPRRSFSFTREDVKPGNLFRRLSGRGPPPTAYRANTFEVDRPPQRSASSSAIPQRRASNAADSHTFNSEPKPRPVRRASYDPHTDTGMVPRPIGNFQRRPTNLSEKAAKKGGGVGLDDEGDIINDHINLEGGLDIVINCEVNQKDPAGITTPYRLLVPALFYDGTSDEQHEEEAEGRLQRRPTLLNRLGIGKRRKRNLADNQGKGNWGGRESDTESYTETEDETDNVVHQPPPPVGPRLASNTQPASPLRPAKPHFGPRGATDGYGQGQTQPLPPLQQSQGQQRPVSQGYAGVEAYRDKGKRRWF
ncbi:MAG: hypothetical protein Q9227_002447 [Pyrenula ochraceoflavens]